MNQEVVRIEILSKDIKSSEELKYAIIQESKYFEERVHITRKIEELNNIKEINILIVIIENRFEKMIKDNLEMLKCKAKEVIFICKNKKLLEGFNLYRNIKIFSGIEDNRAIAFSILYNYYEKMKNKSEKHILKDQMKKLKNSMKKFEISEESKASLSESIDEIVMENLSHNSVGYEDLKTMIMFCIINEIDIDEEQNYEYIYKAVSEINSKRIIDLKKNIKATLGLIRNRKKKLKIQEMLSKIKNRQAVEQVILIGKEVKKQIK